MERREEGGWRQVKKRDDNGEEEAGDLWEVRASSLGCAARREKGSQAWKFSRSIRGVPAWVALGLGIRQQN